MGLEFYAADDLTKIGEHLELLDTATRISNGTIEGNVFSVQGTAVAGTVFVRPIARFENVNGTYSGQAQANAFVFDSFLSVAPQPGDEYLKNPGFEDLDSNGALGDVWGKFGNVDFNEFFGPGNPHASFFADTIGNSGRIYQQSILATPGAVYQFELTNVRIEANFDADLFFGLEYYADDDFTKLGETIVQIDTTTTGDGLSFAMVAEAVAGAKYVRPIVRFDNVGSSGGSQRNVFVFAASLTELAPGANQLYNPEFLDLDEDTNYGDGWFSYFNAGFNNFFGHPHASLYGDFTGNSGGVLQLGIPALPGGTYQFDLLDTRIEENWDADLRFGFEYYAADDATKLGEELVLIDTATRIANGTIDGNVFSMQGTVVPGAAIIRPIVNFDNVNSGYAAEPQASAFIFNTFLRFAPGAGDQHLKNPGFDDVNGDGNFGDLWGSYGTVGFNEFFGPNNPHASFFADTIGNAGGIYQQAILGTPGRTYRFVLADVRIEENFDADLFFGLEFYGADDFVKIGEVLIPIDTSVTGDGLSYSMTGTAVAGTVYVRPIVFFDNVGTTGGEQRNAFIFSAALTLLGEGDVDNDGDVDLDDYEGFQQCLFGPDVVPAPEAPLSADKCLSVFDFELDNDVDLTDFAAFTQAFTG
jgi:hypothetical protein